MLNDLYKVSEGLDANLRSPDGIHYTEEGFNALGDVVAKKILEIL